MLFFVANDGTIIKGLPSPVYQGAANTNTIYLIAPFAANTSVTVAFTMPNGVVTAPAAMTAQQALQGIVNAETGQTYAGWSYAIPNSITEKYGVVTAQFFFYSAQAGVITATSATTFTVAKGVPAVLPDTPDDDVYEAILSNLAAQQEQLNNGAFAARSIYAWNSTYTYGTNEITFYPDIGEFGAFVQSVQTGNTNHAPYNSSGVLNSAWWKEVVNFSSIAAAFDSLQTAVESAQTAAETARDAEENAQDAAEEAQNSASQAATSASAAASSAQDAADSAALAEQYAQLGIQANTDYTSVDDLPIPGSTTYLYLIPASDGSEQDVYDEYLWIPDKNAYELIGSTRVDLSGYAKTTGTYASMTVGTAARVTGSIGGKSLLDIFEPDGVTVKRATSAGEDGNGNVISSTYAKQTGLYTGMTVGNAWTAINAHYASSAGKASEDSSGNDIEETYVSTNAQTFTDTQQQQARDNIGAKADKYREIYIGTVTEDTTVEGTLSEDDRQYAAAHPQNLVFIVDPKWSIANNAALTWVGSNLSTAGSLTSEVYGLVCTRAGSMSDGINSPINMSMVEMYELNLDISSGNYSVTYRLGQFPPDYAIEAERAQYIEKYDHLTATSAGWYHVANIELARLYPDIYGASGVYTATVLVNGGNPASDYTPSGTVELKFSVVNSAVSSTSPYAPRVLSGELDTENICAVATSSALQLYMNLPANAAIGLTVLSEYFGEYNEQLNPTALNPTVFSYEGTSAPSGAVYAIGASAPFIPEAVLYTQQSLNSSQQSQARENIGAAGTSGSYPELGAGYADKANGVVATLLNLGDDLNDAVPEALGVVCEYIAETNAIAAALANCPVHESFTLESTKIFVSGTTDIRVTQLLKACSGDMWFRISAVGEWRSWSQVAFANGSYPNLTAGEASADTDGNVFSSTYAKQTGTYTGMTVGEAEELPNITIVRGASSSNAWYKIASITNVGTDGDASLLLLVNGTHEPQSSQYASPSGMIEFDVRNESGSLYAAATINFGNVPTENVYAKINGSTAELYYKCTVGYESIKFTVVSWNDNSVAQYTLSNTSQSSAPTGGGYAVIRNNASSVNGVVFDENDDGEITANGYTITRKQLLWEGSETTETAVTISLNSSDTLDAGDTLEIHTNWGIRHLSLHTGTSNVLLSKSSTDMSFLEDDSICYFNASYNKSTKIFTANYLKHPFNSSSAESIISFTIYKIYKIIS